MPYKVKKTMKKKINEDMGVFGAATAMGSIVTLICYLIYAAYTSKAVQNTGLVKLINKKIEQHKTKLEDLAFNKKYSDDIIKGIHDQLKSRYKNVYAEFMNSYGSEDYKMRPSMKNMVHWSDKDLLTKVFDKVHEYGEKTQPLKENNMNKGIILNFYGEQETVKISTSTLNTGATVCVLKSSDGQPFATLSVGIPGKSELLPHGEFFLKDYSENKEITDQLIKQGILVATGQEETTGFVHVKTYKVADVYVNDVSKMNLGEVDAKVNDYKVSYSDKNGKPQEMSATAQDYKEKIDDLKNAGNKNIAAAKVTDVVKEQKLRKLIRKKILKELKGK